MTLREQIEEHERQWRLFHEWEAAHTLPDRDAARLVADVGALLDWVPADVRLLDPDPGKLGVQRMFDALGRLHSPV